MVTKIESPVLLIAFNRPETTQKVFNAIRIAKPKKLYFAVDAPRVQFPEDQNNVEQVKDIINQVDWDCEVFTRFAQTNQGCGPGPYNAITWAFENEEKLIILEDDCVPAKSFFNYCYELLEKYKNDERIWMISGNNYNEEAVTTQHSYFFSKYGHSWGWATWKRCWMEMDMNMNKLSIVMQQDLLKSGFYSKKEYLFFLKIFLNVFNDETIRHHVWDYQFNFTIRINNGLSIVPKRNLVTNIGYIGTHSTSRLKYHDRDVDNNFTIISHPDFILCDNDYDSFHFKNHVSYKVPLYKRIYRKIYKLFNKGITK